MPQNRQDLGFVLVAGGSAHIGPYDELGTPSRVCHAFAHVAGIGTLKHPSCEKKKKDVRVEQSHTIIHLSAVEMSDSICL